MGISRDMRHSYIQATPLIGALPLHKSAMTGSTSLLFLLPANPSRSGAPDYLAATDNYVANIGQTIAKAQITNVRLTLIIKTAHLYPNQDAGIDLEGQSQDKGVMIVF